MRVATWTLIAVLASCAPALAQVQRTYWGVDAGITPKWKVPTTFKPLFDADALVVTGSSFEIGFVRGSIRGGDWGVSYVRKSIRDTTTVSRLDTSCVGCGVFFTSPDARMSGVEVRRFASFGTIKERVQIGMNLAVGVAQIKGTVRSMAVTGTGTTIEEVDAKTLFQPCGTDIKVVPLGKLEFAVAGILGPDVKVRGSGGFDSLGYSTFSIAVVYFVGAR